MNQSLAGLVQKRRITREEAMHRTTIPEELEGLLGAAGAASPASSAPGGTRPTSVFGRR
jgi:hypothetical protein